MNPIAVFTTVGTLDEARTIASTLVHRRLAACVQISEIESFYTWNAAVQNEKEFRILVKTTASQYDAVEAALAEVHSYELPAIYAVAWHAVYAPYADWIAENSGGE